MLLVLIYKTHFKPLGDTQIVSMGHSTNAKEIMYCRPVIASFGKGYRDNKGLNPPSMIYEQLRLHSFTSIKYSRVNLEVLRLVFGDIKEFHVRLMFKVLEAIVTHPYRNKTFIGNCLSADRLRVTRILEWLVSNGYVSIVMRPRKLMMLNSYTMDKTYLINKKGKRVMQEVYEAVGLM